MLSGSEKRSVKLLENSVDIASLLILLIASYIYESFVESHMRVSFELEEKSHGMRLGDRHKTTQKQLC